MGVELLVVVGNVVERRPRRRAATLEDSRSMSTPEVE